MTPTYTIYRYVVNLNPMARYSRALVADSPVAIHQFDPFEFRLSHLCNPSNSNECRISAQLEYHEAVEETAFAVDHSSLVTGQLFPPASHENFT